MSTLNPPSYSNLRTLLYDLTTSQFTAELQALGTEVLEDNLTGANFRRLATMAYRTHRRRLHLTAKIHRLLDQHQLASSTEEDLYLCRSDAQRSRHTPKNLITGNPFVCCDGGTCFHERCSDVPNTDSPYGSIAASA
jgi:hypothetical protein